MRRLVDLSHDLVAGKATYPWLPAPRMTEFLSRDASREHYAAGTSFVIHELTFIGNSGTYLDAPFHRHADGADLADLPLERIANVPGIVVDVRGSRQREMTPEVLPDEGGLLENHAVLFLTGREHLWDTNAYLEAAPYVGNALARRLVEEGVALVGIEALNADNTDDLTRPAHTVLLGAGIPIVENLRGLSALPKKGFRFTAAPVRFRGGSAFPVRAHAVVD